MNKRVKKLAIGLLILGLPILANGCEGCSNNSNNPDDQAGHEESSDSDNNNKGSGSNANNNNGNGGNTNNNNGNGGNTNNNNGNGGNANNNANAKITGDMIKSVDIKGLGAYVGLVPFLEKMKQGQVVNLEEKIDGLGTPMGTICNMFITHYGGISNYNSTRLELFDYLLSEGASLNGIAPSGEPILEYVSKLQGQPYLDLTSHVLQYKDKIDPATVQKAYKAAKADGRQEIVKLFNDVGIKG